MPDILLTVLLIAFKSLVLMVSLLVFIAYILYGRPQGLGGGAAAPGAQCGRALGAVAEFLRIS